MLAGSILYQSSAVPVSGNSAVPVAGKEDVKRIFHQLMDIIDRTLTVAQNSLNKALDKVKEKATDLEGKATKEADKILAPLRKKLDDLINKAKAAGFDITKCQPIIDDFSNIPNTLVHDLANCINSPVKQAQDIANNAFDYLKNIQRELNSIDSEIDNCGGNVIQKAFCYGNIIKKIAKIIKEAPAEIMNHVAKATELITKLIPTLEDCFVNGLKDAGVNATNDVTKFAMCAAV